MIALMQQVVDRGAEQVAVEGREGSLTFAALWRAVARLAVAIDAVADDSAPVGVMLPASGAYLAAVLACLAARRVCVLFDTGYPAVRNAEIASLTGVRLMLTASDTPPDPAWRGLSAAPAFDDAGTVPDLPHDALDPDAPAFILCTSGSTGRPKALAHSQRTMLHWVRTITNALHVTPEDRTLSISSPASLGGFTALLTFPLAGASLQMTGLSTGGFRDLLQTLENHPVSILRAGPSLLRNLVTLPGAPSALHRLRVVQTYGEPLLKADLDLLRPCLSPTCLIRTTYGATEASGLSWFAGEPDHHHPVRVASGTLMPDTQAMIVDDEGRPCGPGEEGELIIRSRYNALGEWENGAMMAGRLQPDPVDPSQRIYATGDLARCSADGVFVVLGRKDRMVNINGQRAEPAEVEAALRRAPEVEQAAAIVVAAGERVTLVAFIVPRPGTMPDIPRLREMVRAVLPVFMMPSQILKLDRLPMLAGGKLDEAALRAMIG